MRQDNNVLTCMPSLASIPSRTAHAPGPSLSNSTTQSYLSSLLYGGVYGGKRRALQAALTYRDELLHTLRSLPVTPSVRSGRRTIAPGWSASRASPWYSEKAGVRGRWTVGWPCGLLKISDRQKRFSVKKYGERGAFVLKARQAALKRLQETLKGPRPRG